MTKTPPKVPPQIKAWCDYFYGLTDQELADEYLDYTLKSATYWSDGVWNEGAWSESVGPVHKADILLREIAERFVDGVYPDKP